MSSVQKLPLKVTNDFGNKWRDINFVDFILTLFPLEITPGNTNTVGVILVGNQRRCHPIILVIKISE